MQQQQQQQQQRNTPRSARVMGLSTTPQLAPLCRPLQQRRHPQHALQPGRRSTCCCAGAKSPNSTVSSRTAAPPQPVAQQREPQQQHARPQKGLQEHARGVQERVNNLVHYLTPKQEGDVGDVLMIGVSLAVFIWLAMQLYRLWYFAHLQLGVMDMYV